MTEHTIKISDEGSVSIVINEHTYHITVRPEGSLAIQSSENMAFCPHGPRHIEIVTTDRRVKKLTRRPRT